MKGTSRSVQPRVRALHIVLSLLLTASAFFGVSAIAEESPPPAPLQVSPEETIVIPSDWKTLTPFSARFLPAPEKSRGIPWIDLEATSFPTEGLVGMDKVGQRTFGMPNLDTFAPKLVRQPFTRSEKDLFVVQARSPEDQQTLWRNLEEMGLEVRGYIPHLAYLVELDAAQHRELAQLQEIVWMGFFQPAWRVSPQLDFLMGVDAERQLHLTVDFDRGHYASTKALETALATLGLEALGISTDETSFRVEVRTAVSNAHRLAALNGCLWVERQAQAGLLANIARTSSNVATGRGSQAGPIMDVEDVWSRGIRGEGQIAAVADTGLSTGNLATLHHDFGQQNSKDNPMRVIQTYSLTRPTWDDDFTISNGGHGTHVTGLLLGNGVRSGSSPQNNSFPAGSYTGIAPKAQLVFQSFMRPTGGISIPTDLETLFLPPYQDGARVHSNSWIIFNSFGQYESRARDADEFAWDYKDMVLVFGAGNDGRDVSNADGIIDPDSIGPPGTSKNGITVGASETYRPNFVLEWPANDCDSNNSTEQMTWGWYSDEFFPTSNRYGTAPIYPDLFADHAGGLAPFSSRGPTDDNRLKPDVVAPGGFIMSTRSDMNQQPYEYGGDCNIPAGLETFYVPKEGTSMSTPLVAGAAVLTRQYYEDGWHPNGSSTTHGSPVSADGFSPSSALVKATLINGAWDMTPGQYGGGATQEIPPAWDGNNDLPNNASGYGRLDLESALFPGSGFGHAAGRKLEVHDITPGLSTSQQDTYTFQVSSSTDPLTITLVWTDPAASAGAGAKLVNNLDLEVVSPAGTTYYPNGVDRTIGSADSTNNVEQTRVTSPQTGTWTVRVKGTSVPGSGVAGSTVQPYALVASAVLGTSSGNQPPVCVDDYLTTPKDTRLSIFRGDLLGNDSDPNGDTLWLWNYDLVTDQGGSNDTGHIGGFNYTPPTGFTGMDRFSYTIADRGDGTGLTDTCNVFIDVTGANPPMAEVGAVTDLTHVPQTVFFNQTYTNPVVIAQPPSYNGSHTSVVRITQVLSDRFTFYVHEAPNLDGAHTIETVSYLVVEAGDWQLDNGAILRAGTVNTSSTVGFLVNNSWATVNYGGTFPGTPVVLSQVQTNNDPYWVKTRQNAVGGSSFQVALEEDEASTTSHGVETVGWIAITAGSGTWNGVPFVASRTPNAVTHAWYTVNFSSVGSSPKFLASMHTYDGAHNAGLRYQNLGTTSVQVRVEEDTAYDTETSHTTEAVNYLVFGGSGILRAAGN